MIHFAYPWVLPTGLLALFVIIMVRLRWNKRTAYAYPLIAVTNPLQASWKDMFVAWAPTILYISIITLLIIALARPRLPDERTQINVDGIGIMLVLDVSQSMICCDDPTNLVSRFSCAQEEAINFINRRPRDLFGLVLFGRIAATRCPLTIDHRMLIALIRTLKIGIIPDDETSLAQAIIMGVSRLQSSSAKNNIMVLLTDGEPSDTDQALLPEAIALAQKASIKIYTIGIGSPTGGFIKHPLMGLIQVSSCLRPEILRNIAHKTSGSYFEAQNPQELAHIYATIDQLETSTQKEPVYAQWCEYYAHVVIIALFLLIITWGILAWWVIL